MIDPITTSYQAVQAYYMSVPQVRNEQGQHKDTSAQYSSHIQNNVDKAIFVNHANQIQMSTEAFAEVIESGWQNFDTNPSPTDTYSENVSNYHQASNKITAGELIGNQLGLVA